MRCPQCQHDNPPEAKYCLECGAPVLAECSACGTKLPPAAKFCLECGASLGHIRNPQDPRAYTPKHLADKILQSKSALEGERKTITALFADIKGSMELL